MNRLSNRGTKSRIGLRAQSRDAGSSVFSSPSESVGSSLDGSNRKPEQKVMIFLRADLPYFFPIPVLREFRMERAVVEKDTFQ